MTTPILFLIFNRPKETALVFERIKAVRPRYLFVAADGARKTVPSDSILCAQTRAIVQNIDWDCNIQYLFRDENLGCGKGVSSAISWFFEHVEEGIILEDDCLPDLSFFSFAETMLMRYRFEPKVMQIAGTNYLFKAFASDTNSYYMSAYNAIWGWATWRRAWQLYEFKIENVDNIEKILQKRYKLPNFVQWLLSAYKDIATGKIDTWDTQWHFTCQKNDGLCVVPNVNLIANIGYIGTHGKEKSPFNNMPTRPFDLANLIKSPPLSIDYEKDEIMIKNILNPKIPLLIRIKRKIKRLFR